MVIGGDGEPLLDPRQDIPAAQLPLPVVVEGQPLALHDEVYLPLNKPVGYVTALRDDRHPVAAALLPRRRCGASCGRSGGWTSTPAGFCCGPPAARGCSG